MKTKYICGCLCFGGRFSMVITNDRFQQDYSPTSKLVQNRLQVTIKS